ncbi:PP-loop family protein, partial [Chlamydia psittaci C1/97]
FWSSS